MPLAADTQATVEFTLVLPLFIILILGLIGFAKAFTYWSTGNHIANEAVRWAVVDRNPQNTVGANVEKVYALNYPAQANDVGTQRKKHWYTFGL